MSEARPTWQRWAIPVAAVAVGLSVGAAGGIGIGLASSDPTGSTEYRSLAQELGSTRSDLEAAQGSIAAAESSARAAEASAAAEATALDERSAQLDQREQSVAGREAAVAAVEQRIAATSVGDGIWTVGVDIEPGTYRTKDAVTSDCYWGIYRTGSNQDDIIQNAIVTGGFPTVQLDEGQDFENNGCGTFVKQ